MQYARRADRIAARALAENALLARANALRLSAHALCPFLACDFFSLLSIAFHTVHSDKSYLKVIRPLFENFTAFT